MNSLPLDVVGTNPKNPPVVDHTWLAVDLGNYVNFPSDNQPLRTLPKLSEIWNPPQAKASGIDLVPNKTCPCLTPVQSAEVSAVVREAKKAMMAGVTGHDLADHIKARFTVPEIKAATEELYKLSSEQGLLGNVYIDASAFESYKDAERFLTKHRARLARDILAGGDMSKEVLATLASDFRKNVVASVTYDENLFKTYKDHLVALGKISRDTVIDSKESLQAAFLAKPQASVDPEPKQSSIKVEASDVAQAIEEGAARSELKNRLASEEINFRQLKPVVAFAREQMSKGVHGADLKQVLRDRYTTEQLKAASKYFAVLASDKNTAAIPGLVDSNKIAKSVGNELTKLAKEFPLRRNEYVAPEPRKAAGAQGYFMAVTGRTKTDDRVVNGAVQALRIGHDINKIRKALMSRMSVEAANLVLTEAIRLFNAAPSGVRANKPAKAAKVVIEDTPRVATTPSPEKTKKQADEIIATFDGIPEMVVDVGVSRKYASIDVQEQFNRSGMDSLFNS